MKIRQALEILDKYGIMDTDATSITFDGYTSTDTISHAVFLIGALNPDDDVKVSATPQSIKLICGQIAFTITKCDDPRNLYNELIK